MCGIVGYVGPRSAAPILLNGLTRLEYRGYDSAGIAVQNGRGVATRKVAGRVCVLGDLIEREPICGYSGIGHTRWATHGGPTSSNAHPHTDCGHEIALVHNGIIENSDELRYQLTRAGHRMRSETDTETLAHLIEDAEGDTLEERVASALCHVTGTYGLAVMSAQEPGKLVIARQGSPVLIGIGEGEFFVASDAMAVAEHTKSVVYLNDGDMAVITRSGYRVIDRQARTLDRVIDEITTDVDDLGHGGYSHYMQKEIFDQPRAVMNALRGRLLADNGNARLDGLNLSEADCARIERVVLLGCGTSWHAALAGRHFIEQLAGLPVQVEYASEFRYRANLSMSNALVVAISQSGETADTLEGMRAARARGARVVGIVNVVGSSIAREADGGIYLHAGPEIGVASTKCFTNQLAVLMMLALYLGRRRNLSLEDGRAVVQNLTQVPQWISSALLVQPEVELLAMTCAFARSFLYLGRGVSMPIALEGALKLKEISYIHAEGYPAAEMKHGPIALVDRQMPVVVVAPGDAVYAKTVANIHEVRARGGRVIAITSTGNGTLRGTVEHQVQVPQTPPLFSPFVSVIPLQLLAYHIAVLRDCDVDRPRNLAKSVTVE